MFNRIVVAPPPVLALNVQISAQCMNLHLRMVIRLLSSCRSTTPLPRKACCPHLARRKEAATAAQDEYDRPLRSEQRVKSHQTRYGKGRSTTQTVTFSHILPSHMLRSNAAPSRGMLCEGG